MHRLHQLGLQVMIFNGHHCVKSKILNAKILNAKIGKSGSAMVKRAITTPSSGYDAEKY